MHLFLWETGKNDLGLKSLCFEIQSTAFKLKLMQRVEKLLLLLDDLCSLKSWTRLWTLWIFTKGLGPLFFRLIPTLNPQMLRSGADSQRLGFQLQNKAAVVWTETETGRSSLWALLLPNCSSPLYLKLHKDTRSVSLWHSDEVSHCNTPWKC